MAHAVEDKEDKEEPKYQFMLTLKYKHDQVTNDSVQGYIKKQLKCTNMHHITVPINIQDIIMHFYSKEQFDKHGEILSLNLLKNQVEYCHYEQFFIYNSVWCCREICMKQPYVYGWIIKIITIGSLNNMYRKNHVQIAISSNEHQKECLNTSVVDIMTAMGPTCYGHNFETNITFQNSKRCCTTKFEEIDMDVDMNGQLNKNDEIKISCDIPSRTIELFKNNCLISTIKNMEWDTQEKYYLVVSMADPDMIIQLIESTRVKI